MGSVRFEHVTKRYGRVEAVKDLNLDIPDGQFMTLVGPSGCGKSTTLNMLAGLDDVTEGATYIDDLEVSSLPPGERDIAMVFQSYALYPHLSVRNNIAFPLQAAKMAKAEQEQRIAWAAGILGIDTLLDRKPRQLSGGQRQRVALARALVREPAVFLLDEPLSNLDAQRRASARDELQGFQRRVGTTTIYVTHDQVEAMGMGDRIAVLDQGRLRQLGTPAEIYDDPADTFVATFLGSPPMNLVPAEDSRELLGFRPEHFIPYPTDGRLHDDLVRFPFRVHRVEYLGAERLLYGEIGDAKAVARFPVTVGLPVEVGATHDFAVPRRDLKRFDAATGLRIPAGMLV